MKAHPIETPIRDHVVFLIGRYGIARRDGACLGKRSADWMAEILYTLDAYGWPKEEEA